MSTKRRRPERQRSKRQVTAWQRQKSFSRLILAAGILVIVAVLAILGTGWYRIEYQPLHEVVLEVDGTTFNMGYYIDALKFYAGENATYEQLYAYSEAVSKAIEQNELIRQGGAKLGYTIYDEEADEALESKGLAKNRASQDVMRIQLLMTKLLTEHFSKEIPETAEHRQVMVMFLESETQVQGVRKRLESGEDFGTIAAELSLDAATKNDKGDLGLAPRGVFSAVLGSSLAEEYFFNAEIGSISQSSMDDVKTKSVGYWLIKVVEKNQESNQVHILGILLGSQEEAERARARLDAGEDFAALAKELSQHENTKENGGDLGQVSPDNLPSVIKDFVTSSEPGTVSSPLRDESIVTKGGYWLFKVLAKDDNKKIEDENLTILKNAKMTDWVSSLEKDSSNIIKNQLDDSKVAWAISRLAKI